MNIYDHFLSNSLFIAWSLVLLSHFFLGHFGIGKDLEFVHRYVKPLEKLLELLLRDDKGWAHGDSIHNLNEVTGRGSEMND